jgi:hypothetical protein
LFYLAVSLIQVPYSPPEDFYIKAIEGDGENLPPANAAASKLLLSWTTSDPSDSVDLPSTLGRRNSSKLDDDELNNRFCVVSR